MAKGIIVVEMPDYCDYCQLGRVFGTNGGVECKAAPEGRCVAGYGFNVKRPDWCQMRPMPERKEVQRVKGVVSLSDFERKGKQIGWNDCVDYLEGINGE